MSQIKISCLHVHVSYANVCGMLRLDMLSPKLSNHATLGLVSGLWVCMDTLVQHVGECWTLERTLHVIVSSRSRRSRYNRDLGT